VWVRERKTREGKRLLFPRRRKRGGLPPKKGDTSCSNPRGRKTAISRVGRVAEGELGEEGGMAGAKEKMASQKFIISCSLGPRPSGVCQP